MFRIIIIFLSIFKISYSQCDNLIEFDCESISGCEWVENFENGWCGSYDNNASACNSLEHCSYSTCPHACNWAGSAECESYPGCSYSFLTYSCSGTTYLPCCSGGSFQQDSSYCQEIPSCSEMNQLQCISSSACEWIEDTQNENCYGIAWNEQDCEEVEGCTWWTSSYYGTANCAGSYEADNSYCEDTGILYCSEINELECVNSSFCEWSESIQYYSCSQFNSSDQCNSYSEYGCYTSWNSTTWEDDCNGPSFQIDTSYCTDLIVIPGDSNGDGSLNVTDIIITVDLILSAIYDEYSDMNQDGVLNIIDVVELVNAILEI